jgi:hypothetical protein
MTEGETKMLVKVIINYLQIMEVDHASKVGSRASQLVVGQEPKKQITNKVFHAKQ